MKNYVGLLLFFLNGYNLSAQNPIADSLHQQFRTYQLQAPQEKMYVHTDKTFYLTGETIWLKAYLVDASFHRPSGVSSISYIEVLNKDMKPVMQAKISMKKGFGNGYLIIPGFLNSGNYILRGYTNWMKNFSPDFYFEQPITIVNTLKRLTANSATKQSAAIQFFPEGGNLLAGFSAKVAFKAVDSNGTGLNCHGIIINQSNDTMVSFQSFHNGMGSFQFKPERNTDYYAILRLDDSLIKQKLPFAEDHGFCMDLLAEDREMVKVRVRATPEFNGGNIFLFAQTRQTAKNMQVKNLINGEAIFVIDKKDLGDGISTVTIFNSERQPVCERLIFKRQDKILAVTATSDQHVYEKRSQVNIELTTRTNNQPVSGNFSISVCMIDALQKMPKEDIVSYFNLSSDLKGTIESPAFYFENDERSTDTALDNLLLTQGWRRFKWRYILNGRKPAFEFIPEMEGEVASGRIINKRTGDAAAGIDAFISMPGEDRVFNITTSDSKGMIHDCFRDIYRNNVIIMQPALKNDSDYRIDIMNNWSDKYSTVPVHSLTLSKTEEKELLSRSVNNQIENTFAIEKKRLYPGDYSDSISFYGQPDRVYFLDQYARYQTMEEVLREFVNDVRVRKDNGKFNLRVKNSHTDLYYEGLPLILLDGIPVDAPAIVGLDPLQIKKIELVALQYYFGLFVFNGIINVKSYHGEAGASQINPNATVMEYGAIQMQREFYSPSYANESARQTRLPDFRNVLYWTPQIVTDANGKSHFSFFTSNITGKFIVNVEGITSDGIPGKTITAFEVRDSGILP